MDESGGSTEEVPFSGNPVLISGKTEMKECIDLYLKSDSESNSFWSALHFHVETFRIYHYNRHGSD